MLSLTKLAAIARQYGVDFEVRFTAQASFVYIGGRPIEHAGSQFYHALLVAGARMRSRDGGTQIQLESLT